MRETREKGRERERGRERETQITRQDLDSDLGGQRVCGCEPVQLGRATAASRKAKGTQWLGGYSNLAKRERERERGEGDKERERERVRDADNQQDLDKAGPYSSNRLENYDGYSCKPSDRLASPGDLAVAAVGWNRSPLRAFDSGLPSGSQGACSCGFRRPLGAARQRSGAVVSVLGS